MKKKTYLDIIKQSTPRPEIRQRSAVFEDKTKYKRSRDKQRLRKEHSGDDPGALF